MKIDRAIEAAIQYETRVRDVYRSAAEKCDDETGKRVLRVLAEEEQQHLDYLVEKLKEWKQTGRLTPAELRSVVPDKEAIAASVARLESRVASPDCAAEADLLGRALELEGETSEFYRRMVDELEGEARALFEPFVDIEEGHLMIVQAEIDNLNGLGFWFDFKEFDLEAG